MDDDLIRRRSSRRIRGGGLFDRLQPINKHDVTLDNIITCRACLQAENARVPPRSLSFLDFYYYYYQIPVDGTRRLATSNVKLVDTHTCICTCIQMYLYVCTRVNIYIYKLQFNSKTSHAYGLIIRMQVILNNEQIIVRLFLKLSILEVF